MNTQNSAIRIFKSLQHIFLYLAPAGSGRSSEEQVLDKAGSVLAARAAHRIKNLSRGGGPKIRIWHAGQPHWWQSSVVMSRILFAHTRFGFSNQQDRSFSESLIRSSVFEADSSHVSTLIIIADGPVMDAAACEISGDLGIKPRPESARKQYDKNLPELDHGGFWYINASERTLALVNDGDRFPENPILPEQDFSGL